MTAVKNSVDWTQSDAIAEALSAQGCHIVLETSPPDYVEKISRYLESSVGRSTQDEAPNDPAEADSDSGDSLFITQTPVPEAVRSGRRRRHCYRSRSRSRSDPGSPSDLLESEDEASSSQADEERREKKCGLPKYTFPFLTQRKGKPRSTVLPVQQNTSLHNHAMGGFFKCVRELWQSYQRGEDLLLSLPTVYVDGEHISPLSEEEKSEDEDIKVVEKKRFVAPSKAKRQQTWGDQVKQPRKRKATCARQKNSEGTQRKMLHETPAKSPVSRVTLLSSDTESSDDGGSSRKVLVEKKRNPERVRRDRNLLAQTETQKTNRRLAQRNKKIQQKAREEELCSDSDATFCEPRELQRSPRQHTQKRRKATETDTQTQNVLHIDDPSQPEEQPEGQHLLHSVPELLSDTGNDRTESSVKRRKKKEKDKGDHESVEEGNGQSQDGLCPATSLTVEPEESPGLSEDNGAEPLASQPGDELEFIENGTENFSHNDNVPRQEEREIPHSEQKKKKRKKSRSAAENVGQEVDGNVESDVRVEDSVISARGDMEDGGTVKKKKKKKKTRSDEEQLQSVAKPLDDDAVTQKKKEKRTKEVMTEEREEEEVVLDRTLDLSPLFTGQLEESGLSLDESSYVKRKKHKKKRQSSANDAYQDEEEGVALSFSNDAVTLAESAETPLKKKKKKKKTVSEGGDVAHTPEENKEVENLDDTLKTQEGHEEQNAEPVAKKKKKKKRTSEIPEDNVAQNDDSVSVRKKEKKKRTSSFLVADAEESGAQTHGEPNAAELETELAAGNLEESNDGVRKKKKKRKDSVEKGQEQDFEEPNETCQSSALPETPDTSVKRKKKQMGSESESVTPVERLENAADSGHCPTDEAAVLKKKKKKKSKDELCHVIQESPPPATQDTESEKSTVNTSTPVSHKKKGKKLEEETVAAFDYASPPSETPGNVVLNYKKKKKKRKSTDNVSFDGESLTECAELEPKDNKKKKKKERYITPSSPELSDSVVNSKCTKVKRRLHNPNDFFTGF